MTLDKSKILELNNGGFNLQEIALYFNVSAKTLYRFLTKEKLTLTKNGKTKKIDEDTFIKKCIKKYGEDYFSKYQHITPYISYDKPMEIECLIHSQKFTVTPKDHIWLKFSKCEFCSPSTLQNRKEKFITDAKNKFGNQFDYSNINFINSATHVMIKCKDHGEFKQTPHEHLSGDINCPKCLIIFKQIPKGLNAFKEKVQHTDIEIVDSTYNGLTKKMQFICKKHGMFECAPIHFLIRRLGCTECELSQRNINQRHDKNLLLARLNKIHNHKYDYSKTIFRGNKKYITISCPKHGDFKQKLGAHLNSKHGCPKCGKSYSKFEEFVYETISSVSTESDKVQSKSKIEGKEIDVLFDNRIGFEANGLYFHREGLLKNEVRIRGCDKNYHLNKSILAKENGIKLYHIFEDEYHNNPLLVKHKVLNACGLNKAKKVNGRDCKIVEISAKESNSFLSAYHIQGGDSSVIRYGAMLDGELVGIMTFLKKKDYYELNRFATNYNFHVRGLASKMFAHFVKTHDPNKVITFADRRWTPDGENNLYTKIGFTLLEIQPPVYHYYNPRLNRLKRFNRIRFQKHKILESNKDNPKLSSSMTEKELMIELGYDRIWDCGNFKYIWTKS